MQASEKSDFLRLLNATMASYAKPLPEAAFTAAWWAELAPFPMQVVAAAIAAYKVAEPRFAPTPAAIGQRCVLMDGRPGTEEAWAIALTSRDEAETVVWTREMAEAFALCSPVLRNGDEVGARMAFKDAYARLVSDARMRREPATWQASLGWDTGKRVAVLQKAVAVGLLPAPSVAGLLPPPETSEACSDEKARENIEKLRAMLAGVSSRQERAWQEHSARVEAERAALDARKRAVSQQVADVLRQREAQP